MAGTGKVRFYIEPSPKGSVNHRRTTKAGTDKPPPREPSPSHRVLSHVPSYLVTSLQPLGLGLLPNRLVISRPTIQSRRRERPVPFEVSKGTEGERKICSPDLDSNRGPPRSQRDVICSANCVATRLQALVYTNSIEITYFISQISCLFTATRLFELRF